MKYIIDFQNTATEQQIQDYLSSINATVVMTFNRFEKIYLVETPVTPAQTDIVQHVSRDDENPIMLHSTTVYFDQNFGQNILTGDVIDLDIAHPDNWWKVYSIADIDLEQPVNKMGRRGENATVYVLDSGINTSHPEFANQPVTNIWSFVNDVIADNDTNGHGTAIASVISGRSCGLTNARVKGVKIFQKGVATLQSHMLSALNAIFDDYIQSGMNSGNNGSVVNCSWTIDKNSLIENKIKVMIDAGMLFVCASGNSGIPVENVTPASMPEVVTVGSYNSDFKPSSFSNYSNNAISLTAGDVNHGQLDGWAPGENIRVATGIADYANVAGTSIAAGIHSAVLAHNLNWQLTEFLTVFDPYNFIANSSFGRRNLLDLDDPKYAGSVNKISSVITHLIKEPKEQMASTVRGMSGGPVLMNMFNSLAYEKVELDSDLPDGIKLNTCGRLYGIAPDISALSQDFSLISIPFRATLRTGQVTSDVLNLLIYKQNIDPSTIVTGDPVLNLRLQDGTDCQGCNNAGCFDNCVNRDCTSVYDPACPTKNRCCCYYSDC